MLHNSATTIAQGTLVRPVGNCTYDWLPRPELEVPEVRFRFATSDAIHTILEIPDGGKRMGIMAGQHQGSVDPHAAVAGNRIIGAHHVKPFAPHVAGQDGRTVVIAQVPAADHL